MGWGCILYVLRRSKERETWSRKMEQRRNGIESKILWAWRGNWCSRLGWFKEIGWFDCKINYTINIACPLFIEMVAVISNIRKLHNKHKKSPGEKLDMKLMDNLFFHKTGNWYNYNIDLLDHSKNNTLTFYSHSMESKQG